MRVKVYFSTAGSPLASQRFRKISFAARLILFTCLLVMGYYILQIPGSPRTGTTILPISEIAQLRGQLENGNAEERRQALARLVELHAEDVLVGYLASEQPGMVKLAAAGLWECWLNEEGPSARHQLETGMDAMNAGDLEAASTAFAQTILEHPRWAEAINKQATVLYLQGRLDESIQLCREVVALKPDHFGAWNGMAICAIQTEDWLLAQKAVHESLRLQPHSQANQQLLKLVASRLPEV